MHSAACLARTKVYYNTEYYSIERFYPAPGSTYIKAINIVHSFIINYS